MTYTDHTITARFPSCPEQARIARCWLTEWLGLDHPVADTARLLLSETFSNSVLHGHPDDPESPIDVVASLTDHLLRLEVTDAGRGGEPTIGHDPTGDGESGRGLAILDFLAKEWSWTRLDDGRLRLTVIINF